MEDALLLARTVTRAQRMDAELRRRGITADLIRAFKRSQHLTLHR